MVGHLISFASESEGCSSMAARFAIQTTVRQIVGQNVIDVALVALAPDGRGLYPVRPVRGGILLKKVLAVHPVGIALQGQRPSRQMRNQDGRDAGVVVDDLSLGEAGRGIQDFVQIRQLQLPALNFNHRCSAHAASLLQHECGAGAPAIEYIDAFGIIDRAPNCTAWMPLGRSRGKAYG